MRCYFKFKFKFFIKTYIDGLVQDSSALIAMELLQTCTETSIGMCYGYIRNTAHHDQNSQNIGTLNLFYSH